VDDNFTDRKEPPIGLKAIGGSIIVLPAWNQRRKLRQASATLRAVSKKRPSLGEVPTCLTRYKIKRIAALKAETKGRLVVPSALRHNIMVPIPGAIGGKVFKLVADIPVIEKPFFPMKIEALAVRTVWRSYTKITRWFAVNAPITDGDVATISIKLRRAFKPFGLDVSKVEIGRLVMGGRCDVLLVRFIVE
jgi:hypothetical protein